MITGWIYLCFRFELQINRPKNVEIPTKEVDSSTSPIQANVAKRVDMVRKARIPVIFIIGIQSY